MKIIQSLQESSLLIKSLSETSKNRAKKRKRKASKLVIRYLRGNLIS